MNLAEVQDYSCWVGKTAATVKRAAFDNGGWEAVFPAGKPFPKWASRVRNFFNLTPNYFQRLDKEAEEWWVDYYHTHKKGLARWALSGDAYQDENKRVWLEMSTAASVYHYPGKVSRWKKFKAFVLPQAMMPVFKLVSPDGTGGSREIIVDNPKTGWVKRSGSIASPGQWRKIRDRVEMREEYLGSYNYSETIVKGLPAHELRDVKTHREWPGFYINPHRDSTLEDRVFKECDPQGKVLADQIAF
jgi:hypothetical protein